MKVLFAVNNESISESITKKYQQEYKEIISAKNVHITTQQHVSQNVMCRFLIYLCINQIDNWPVSRRITF